MLRSTGARVTVQTQTHGIGNAGENECASAIGNGKEPNAVGMTVRPQKGIHHK